MKEIWKPIVGYEDTYSVSNLGRVKNIKTNYIKNPQKQSSGYHMISLRNSSTKKFKVYLVHRLVAIAFIPNPYNKRTVNHKNGDKHDNRLNNLEWMTYSENHKHSYAELGTVPGNKFSNELREKVLGYKDKNISQMEVSRLLGVSNSYVSQLWRGLR